MRTLVIGGYGFFGERLCRLLATMPGVELLVAGRSIERASKVAAELGAAAIAIDASDPRLASILTRERIELVVHTSGPFQGQGYAVARACIEAGAHYLDLADGRDFVCGIDALSAEARAANVAVIAGASTVPAISSAVVDALAADLANVRAIRIGITPANRTARGIATVRGVMSYCGKPIRVWREAHWGIAHGWSEASAYDYPAPVERRWFAWVDVPDLALLPARYPGVESVEVKAALELKILQFGTMALGALTRAGIVRDWSRHAGWLKAIGDLFLGLGSASGGMHVEVAGTDDAGQPVTRRWMLLAHDNEGPYVPTLAAAALVRRAAAGAALPSGAMPCIGLLSLGEIAHEARGLAIDFPALFARRTP